MRSIAIFIDFRLYVMRWREEMRSFFLKEKSVYSTNGQ